MIQLPDLNEITWLCGAEPVVLDPEVPIAYNTLTFTATRGDDRIQCVIEPASDQVDLAWARGDQELVKMALGDVAALDVLSTGDREVLRITFGDAALQPLHLRMKPTVYLAWQMTA
jgi:hypothetical protein